MNSMTRWLMCLAMLLGLATTCEAFNGLRKGFVLGGGLGIAPVASWRAESGAIDGADESSVGLASNFLIGYGWDEQNMIVFEGSGAAYQSENSDAFLSQGYGGPAWYHYFEPINGGFLTILGVGFYSFAYDFDSGPEGSNDPGVGLLLGGGYEFSRHWQVTAVVTAGKTSEPGADYSHFTFAALIGGVAF